VTVLRNYVAHNEPTESVPPLGQIVKRMASPLNAGEDWAAPRVGTFSPPLCLTDHWVLADSRTRSRWAGTFSKNETLKLDP